MTIEEKAKIPYLALIEEIDKEIKFYENSSIVQEFEKYSNYGAIGALEALKNNIWKLHIN